MSVRERPIISSGPMVRAILDGRKTQTRRVVKPQPSNHDEINSILDCGSLLPSVVIPPALRMDAAAQRAVDRLPYGAPGDRLWVRETWCPQVDPVAGEAARSRVDGGRR